MNEPESVGAAFTWLQATQTIVMGLATAIVWVAIRSLKLGQWVARIDHTKDIAELGKGLAALERSTERRFDQAGKEASDAADRIQVEIEEVRRDCVSRDMFDRMSQEGRDHRMRLERQIDMLWGEVRTRKEPRG